MAKIKLTKNELKKYKDDLKMFKRYLPTLQLKKQQLQLEIKNVELKVAEVLKKKEIMENEFESWIAVFGEDYKISKTFLTIERIESIVGNIAGVSIPIFKKVNFIMHEYNLFNTPCWVDIALEKIKSIITLDSESYILKQQIKLLKDELQTATQRVNLFEKIKIPEAKEIIKKISIYLGDQQTASVVRGKISKNRLTKSGDAL